MPKSTTVSKSRVPSKRILQPRTEKKSPVRVSVIIPGHNRPDSLRECLRALREQSLSPREYEVIVIGFTQMSLQKVCDENAKLAKHAFTYKEIPTRWPDAKRNEGIRLARAPIVAFTDDDVLPQKDWLEKLLIAFQNHPDAIGVEGRTDGDNTPLLSHATKNLHGNQFPTCNLAFRKSVLEKIKGFDEAYHFFREDTDIAYHASLHGKIIFDSAAKVFHPTRFTPAKAILNELGMTRGEIRLFKKFPQKYRQNYGTFLGLPGRGGWLQAMAAYAIILGGAYAALAFHPAMAAVAVCLLLLFRYFLSFRNRTFSIIQAIQVWTYMLARDVAYPWFFAYFWLTEHPVCVEPA